jgi:hypothetical protein
MILLHGFINKTQKTPQADIALALKRSTRLARRDRKGSSEFSVAIRQPSVEVFFAYATNYLIDTDHGVIVDVEATRAICQAEVGAARTMLAVLVMP